MHVTDEVVFVEGLHPEAKGMAARRKDNGLSQLHL